MHLGEIRSRRNILLMLLRKRFRKVPRDVTRTIQATEDLAQLNTWLEKILVATCVEDMNIHSGDE